MRILIISALPYDISSSTRAFKTYFYKHDKNDIAQFYTNPKTPNLDFCNNFYQITDSDVIRAFFTKNENVGRIYNANTQKEMCDRRKRGFNTSFLKKDIGILHLVRNFFWKENKWFTPNLKKWIRDFNPECVFYHNSNSIFISKIAHKISNFFNIPLLLEISDDYYFSNSFKPLFFETIYRHKYKKMLKTLMRECSGCFFVSEKMSKKYSIFKIKNSDFIYISSELNTDITNTEINKNTFCYFGNTGLNRFKTIIDFGAKINSFDSSFKIDVYGPILGNNEHEKMKKYSFINLCGSLPYEKLIKTISSYEYILIAEPFDKKTAKYIQYSLSTKVADSLALGKKIIFIGSDKCGTIDYLKEHKCGLGIYSKKSLKSLTMDKIDNFDWESAIFNAHAAFCCDFNIANNYEKSTKILNKAVLKEVKDEKR